MIGNTGSQAKAAICQYVIFYNHDDPTQPMAVTHPFGLLNSLENDQQA